MAEPWNINIHYDGKLDKCVPQDTASVLEVGCGDGFLAARLSQRVPRVVAVDVDKPVLERASQRFPSAPVHWRHGDILAIADELGEFDAVVSNATLHHLPDTRDALACWRRLVRPGGTLAVVSFARPGLRHLPWALATFVTRGVAIRSGYPASGNTARRTSRRAGVTAAARARLHPVASRRLTTPAGGRCGSASRGRAAAR